MSDREEGLRRAYELVLQAAAMMQADLKGRKSGENLALARKVVTADLLARGVLKSG